MPALPTTRYRITPRDPAAHLFEVSCTIEDPDPDGHRFRLPVWIPGSYLVREFARNVVSVRAACNGEPVDIDKIAKDTWQAQPCIGTLSVTCDVYAYDVSVRTAYLDQARAFFNGTAVFLLPEGREAAPCLVDIHAHAGDARLRVATTLAAEDAPAFGFGTYRASDYDDLVDHPVEIADFTHARFSAGGAEHDVAITGRHDADVERIASDLQRICQWHADLFGGAPGSRAPFRRYVFQVLVLADGYGGLEHRSSTSLVCARKDLPLRGVERISDDYRTFLGLASHEYFHAWHVKRIRPAAFTPYDLAREGYTRQLWAFEGFTSYYDDLSLVRSGVIDATSYLELVGRTLTSVLRTPGRAVQSLAAASFDAWIKFYRPDENSPNAGVSYYAKGAIVALALDLTLRLAGSSLDALMRALWQRYGERGIGVPEDGIARLASEIGRQDLGDFFARHVDGTDDPPLADLLSRFGVTLRLRASDGSRDRGGTAGRTRNGESRASLGVKASGSTEAKLVHVFRGGAAARAGLAAGDVVIALDGLRTNAEALDAFLDRTPPGRTVKAHAFRRDELIVCDVTLDAAQDDTAFLAVDASADAECAARRLAWLGA